MNKTIYTIHKTCYRINLLEDASGEAFGFVCFFLLKSKITSDK